MPAAINDPGLCKHCQHVRVVRSQRGSLFWLCRAAEHDPRLRKYPQIPVLQCPAYTPAKPGSQEEAE